MTDLVKPYRIYFAILGWPHTNDRFLISYENFGVGPKFNSVTGGNPEHQSVVSFLTNNVKVDGKWVFSQEQLDKLNMIKADYEFLCDDLSTNHNRVIDFIVGDYHYKIQPPVG